MMFVPIIFLGLIIWAIIVFTRQSNVPWRSNGESAIEILKDVMPEERLIKRSLKRRNGL